MKRTSDVIVVGGGINGASIAFHLARQGVKVTLLEKDAIAAGPTGLSCGIIRQHYSHEITARMARHGLEVFQNFDDLVGGVCDFRQTGFALVARPGDVETMAANVEMQRKLGIDTRMITPAELREIEPDAALDGVVAAAYEPEAGYADAHATTTSYAARAAELGATIATGTEMLSIVVDRGRARGVVTPHGRLDAAAVVVATGPWSRAVLGRCGVELPLKAGRVQVGLFNRVSEVESHGIFADTTLGIYVRPESDDFMLVGSLETKEANDFVDDPDVFRDTPDFDRITLYSERLTRRYPPMEEGSYFNGWASLYDVSPDWQPILDEIPGIAGLYCAVGSSGHGFKLAPAVGEMMATLILEGKEAEDDIEMFSIERLVTGRLADGKYANKILG